MGAYGKLEHGDSTANFTISAAPIVDAGREEIAQLAASYNELASGLAPSAAKFDQTTRNSRTVMHDVDDATRELTEWCLTTSRC